MMRQYRRLKARFPDAILLFRLGDFYEMFEEDAQIVSRQLDLVLTTRRFAKNVKLPMCGVPHRQLTPYVSKLLALGHKVAIAEQLEEGAKSRRLIPRDVVRVITPGTVVEEALLAQKAQNFLVALAPQGPAESPEVSKGWGLAAVDLSTGEFVTLQIEGAGAWPRLLEELDVLHPSEILLPADLIEQERWAACLGEVHPARLSPVEPAAFQPKTARERLLRHFGGVSLEPYGCEGLPLATAAAGAALHYLLENQLSDLGHVQGLETYNPEASVGLDAVTRRNLELTCTLRDGGVRGSLLGVLDRTVTAMGARLLRRWLQQPLLDLARIQERLDAVEELCPRPSTSPRQDLGEDSAGSFLRADLRDLLDNLYDMERLVGRIGFGTANARDLVALRQTLEQIPGIKALLATVQSSRLQALDDDLDALQDVASLIGQALVEDPPALLRDGGLIREGYSDELRCLRQSAAEGRDWLTTYEAQERERTGISSLRVRYNQVFGFFVEVPRSKSDQVPPDYERRATITHAERFITPPLQRREQAILSAEERANELEYELFVALREEEGTHIARLQRAARVLAELDVLATLAEVAACHNYVRPVVDDSALIEIKEGRHPVVEQLLPGDARFVANDTSIDADGQRFLVITGPNMSGKSVLIRQVALIALMAQIGSFVPARSARVGLVDRIFVRAGATDDISQGRSTFLVEMSETAYILRHATSRSLVVLDEVGRGTSTYDGMALAWAVGEDLHTRIAARTLFATHFHELTALADVLDGAWNASLAVVEEGHEVVFLYRLVEGGADRSYGVQVARLAGVPVHVVERARDIMARLEKADAPVPSVQPSQLLKEASAGYLGSSAAFPTCDNRSAGFPACPNLEQEDAPPSAGNGLLRAVVQELSALDIANLTPVQALVVLNDLQQRLKDGDDCEV